VGIIETHYHEEYLDTTINIFNHPEVFTLKRIYDELEEETKQKAEFYFYNGEVTAKQWLLDISLRDNLDAILVNTIQPSMIDLPKWIYFKPDHGILTLHNLNAWVFKHFQIKPTPHTFDSFVASKFYCPKILRNFKSIVVVNPTMKRFAEAYFNKPVITIPFSYAREPTHTSNDYPTFVIPGTVDQRRRDYVTIKKAFNIIASKFDVNLIFLGKNGGIYHYRSGKLYTSRVFKSRIPKDEYDSIIKHCDVIICPVKPTTSTVNTCKEWYGSTKSPNIWEAVKWRKPLIITDGIPLPTCLYKSTMGFPYKRYDILAAGIIWALSENHLKEWREKAVQATSSFELHKIREEVSSSIKNIVS